MTAGEATRSTGRGHQAMAGRTSLHESYFGARAATACGTHHAMAGRTSLHEGAGTYQGRGFLAAVRRPA
ncbi:MAG: hypothetical protein EXR44_08265 [Dehalococcoidia bacterium]|nr:hypothetical protein [Dehalococcoidia bacterium]